VHYAYVKIVPPHRALLNLEGFRVLVLFARHGRSKAQSFPRKRESTSQVFAKALWADGFPLSRE